MRVLECHRHGILLFKASHKASPGEIILLMGGAVCAEEGLVVAIFENYLLSLLPTAQWCMQTAREIKTTIAAGT